MGSICCRQSESWLDGVPFQYNSRACMVLSGVTPDCTLIFHFTTYKGVQGHVTAYLNGIEITDKEATRQFLQQFVLNRGVEVWNANGRVPIHVPIDQFPANVYWEGVHINQYLVWSGFAKYTGRRERTLPDYT